MPISYQGFGFTAILVMLVILVVAQGLRFLKERVQDGPENRFQNRLQRKRGSAGNSFSPKNRSAAIPSARSLPSLESVKLDPSRSSLPVSR